LKIAGAIFRPNKLCQKLEFRDVMNVTFWASELFFPAPTPRKDRIKREGRSRHLRYGRLKNAHLLRLGGFRGDRGMTVVFGQLRCPESSVHRDLASGAMSTLAFKAFSTLSMGRTHG